MKNERDPREIVFTEEDARLRDDRWGADTTGRGA